MRIVEAFCTHSSGGLLESYLCCRLVSRQLLQLGIGMDAFEQIVADLLRAEGWWVSTNVRVKLEAAEKEAVGLKYASAFELDIVAYRGRTNTLRVLECKSYMFSKGVQAKEVLGTGGRYKSRYKLFHNHHLQQVVKARLITQCIEQKLCAENPIFELGLVCGKMFSEEGRTDLRQKFLERGWILWDEHDLRQRLQAQTDNYANSTSVLVTKLLTGG